MFRPSVEPLFLQPAQGRRIVAWASPQSHVIAGRKKSSRRRFVEFENRHIDEIVPRPANWGGYRLVPDSIEFW